MWSGEEVMEDQPFRGPGEGKEMKGVMGTIQSRKKVFWRPGGSERR
jgi:hypothetical protein